MTDKKLRIAVMFGGRSGEHEISLLSARSIISAINSDKYEVIQIGITHDGMWLVGEEVLEKFSSGDKISELAPSTILLILHAQEFMLSKEPTRKRLSNF